eukprot:TRINITY_DN1240_c0_g1_i18.p1 TRINITY_DN1240_c0_g1~~TRINITY_DN1240_c0_g1_i18.p1  ORF type:complete len:387 (+),score=65.88 TRINITY_DN1240_c0_g1_i18:107-1267(+)
MCIRDRYMGRKYLERYCKARSAIRAPEKNENAYSVAVPQVYRQCFESNRKCSDEQISDAIIPALQVTVIVPSQSLPKSEIPVTDEVKVPLIEEESKQNQSSTTNFSEEDSPKDSISKTPVTATTLGTNFLIDLMGNPLNGLKLKPLVLSPIPKEGGTVRFVITRNCVGLTKKLYTKYELYTFNSNKFVMAAEKKQILGSAYYGISLEGSGDRGSKGYIGKLRSNLGANEFNLFGEGANPKSGLRAGQVRTQHASIIYCSKSLLGTRRENVDILIPKILENGSYHTWRPMSEGEYMIPCFKRAYNNDLICLRNKPSEWDQSLQAYVSTIKNPLIKASVKNLQIVNPHNDKLVLEFGRIGSESFLLEVAHPFSVFQAFGICLSIFSFL